jgi:hypothetical protein
VHDIDWEKLPIRPPQSSLAIVKTEPSSSKSEGSARRKLWILSTKYLFHTLTVLLHVVKYRL